MDWKGLEDNRPSEKSAEGKGGGDKAGTVPWTGEKDDRPTSKKKG